MQIKGEQENTRFASGFYVEECRNTRIRRVVCRYVCALFVVIGFRLGHSGLQFVNKTVAWNTVNHLKSNKNLYYQIQRREFLLTNPLPTTAKRVSVQ